MGFRLYADENFPLPVVHELRRLGHDVLTLQESGKAEQAVPDEAVLTFATQQERAVLTLNRRDFIHLHGRDLDHYGILVCKFDPDFVDLAQRIHQALLSAGEIRGQLLRIQRAG